MNDKEMILRVYIVVNEDRPTACSLSCPRLAKFGAKTCMCSVFGILEVVDNGIPLRPSACCQNSTDL